MGAAEMCSGSEAGSYLRLIDFVYHSTLGSRVIKKKKKDGGCTVLLLATAAVLPFSREWKAPARAPPGCGVDPLPLKHISRERWLLKAV